LPCIDNKTAGQHRNPSPGGARNLYVIPHEGDHLAEAGAALALNALTGRERAQALEHLQHCRRCRAQTSAMALTSDDLLRLLPDTPPPPGFTNRVTSQLGRPSRSPARSHPRVILAAAAVAVMLVAGGLTGWGLRVAHRPATPAPPLRTAALIAPTHQQLGRVFLHLHGSRWIFFTVDADDGNTTLICQLTTRTGQLITAGTFAIWSGDGYWGTPVPSHSATITGARLITTSGTVLATAHFTVP
jgi:hypothetical protein